MNMKVFISYSLTDETQPYRQAAKNAVMRVGMNPLLLEEQLQALTTKVKLRDALAEPDIYVILVDLRHGIEHNVRKRPRQGEYPKPDGAWTQKPHLIYVTGNLPQSSEQSQEAQELLKLLSCGTVLRRVTHHDHLAVLLQEDLSTFLQQTMPLDAPVQTQFPTILLANVRTLLEGVDLLQSCSPRVFEELIAELLSADGWQVQIVSRTNAPGPDIIAISSKIITNVPTKLIVECKKYPYDRRVDIDVVRKVMYWVNEEYRATFGMIATTSSFTRSALEEQERMHHWRLDLRDQATIIEWINKHLR